MSKAELAAMAEEATVDAYDEDEQAMGFHTMIVDNLEMPFVTSVLGVAVTVEDIDLADDRSILAVCDRGGIRQAIRVVDLPLPDRRPPARSGSRPIGAGWAERYGKGAERAFRPRSRHGWRREVRPGTASGRQTAGKKGDRRGRSGERRHEELAQRTPAVSSECGGCHDGA